MSRLGKGSQLIAGLWVFAALIGLLSAFDILIIGEELSLLGERAHTYFGRSSEAINFWGKLAVGLAAFGLSVVRLVTVGGLLARRRWGYVMAAILVGPLAFLDICMCSPTFATFAVIGDLYLMGAVVRRLTG